MAISVLFIEGEADHVQAMCARVASEGLDWDLRVASSLSQARQLVTKQAFDVLAVSQNLSDGHADALGPLLEKCAALLLHPEGARLDAALLMRQGFTDFLCKDAAFKYLDSLTTRMLMTIERHQMVCQLIQRSETLELAVAGAQMGIWDWRVREDRNIVNERWCEMLGYALEEVVLVGGVWMEWVHPDDLPRLKGALGPGPKTSLQQFEVEFRIHHRQGHWVWIHSRGHVVERDAQGLPTRVIGTHSDITERRQIEHAREQQHRLRLAISAAHDLFLIGEDTRTVFEGLLSELLVLTQSAHGFVGEVLYSAENRPYIKAHALTNIAWDETSRRLNEENLATGMEFHNLKTLFGAALVSGEPVISNEPARDSRKSGIPAGHPSLNAFLGIPIHHGNQLVTMIGLANKPGGYFPADVEFLEPLSRTIGHLVSARRSDCERRRVQEELRKTGELLARNSQLLQVTLDNMNQGLCKVEADGRVSIYNRKALELLDLPESLLARQPLQTEVVQYQTERGDFAENTELISLFARAIKPWGEIRTFDRYVRKTRSGSAMEVRTNTLPDGGMVRTYTDVTAYVEAQSALRASEARFKALVELSSDWYWEQDENFRFLPMEGIAFEVAGVQVESTTGLTSWEVGALNMTQADWQAHRELLAAHNVFRNLELHVLTDNGLKYWMAMSGAPFFDEKGVFRGYRGVGQDISARKQAEQKIERLAFYDVLTELPNRRMLIERLGLAMTSSTRSHQYAALLFIDLDNFKTLNDTHGHYMGDLLLQQVAARLRGSVREVDTVARLGGDEFVVMVEELSQDESQAAALVTKVAEKIVAALNQAYALPGQEHYSTPSMGITLFVGQQESGDELLKRADVAMYQAKAAGRNTLRFFDPAMQAAVVARAEMEKDLRQCLLREKLVLYYQPVVDVDRVITGVEALVRWPHPQRGMIMPAEFIGLAEQSGLILSLGQWVLQAACEQLVAWSGRPETQHLTISVNVSERQIRQIDFVGTVCGILARSGANPVLLKLEITESLLLTDAEDISDKMGALRMVGVRFSLDDFGTGYSSLGYLKRLPINQLKIDKSFVRDVLTDPNDAAIAQTVLALAGSLGLEAVAEGVETEGQLAFLLQSGCRLFQGYLFGKPVPIEELHLE